MLGKILDNFDDFDVEKVMNVVNMVWENRERFMEIVEKLPQMLQDTGDSIDAAGESALAASSLLLGDKKKKVRFFSSVTESESLL